MRRLVIEATNIECALGIDAALCAFDRALLADGDRYCVDVTVPAGDRGTVAVLSALRQHVTARSAGPAHVRFDGRRYTLAVPPADR